MPPVTNSCADFVFQMHTRAPVATLPDVASRPTMAATEICRTPTKWIRLRASSSLRSGSATPTRARQERMILPTRLQLTLAKQNPRACASDTNDTRKSSTAVRFVIFCSCNHTSLIAEAVIQVQTLFDYHRKAPWFQERYDPAPVFENLRKRVRKRGWQGKVHQFLVDLEDGKYDPDLTAIEPAPKPINDTAPSSDAVGDEKPASPVKDESDAKQEDEPMFDDEGDEGRGGRDRVRITTGSDEISIPPEGNEVMIRTIAPDIGRIKLEEVRAYLEHTSPRSSKLT